MAAGWKWWNATYLRLCWMVEDWILVPAAVGVVADCFRLLIEAKSINLPVRRKCVIHRTNFSFFFIVPGVIHCNELCDGTWAKVPRISPIVLNASVIVLHFLYHCIDNASIYLNQFLFLEMEGTCLCSIPDIHHLMLMTFVSLLAR